MPASAVLADSTRVGDAYFMAVGPAVIFLAVLLWVVMTLLASRKPPRHTPRRTQGLPNRGPVQGGIIAGSPSQRSRRDPAPSGEAAAHVPPERAKRGARRGQSHAPHPAPAGVVRARGDR